MYEIEESMPSVGKSEVDLRDSKRKSGLLLGVI